MDEESKEENLFQKFLLVRCFLTASVVNFPNYEIFPREGIRMGSIIESSRKEAYTATSVWLREEDGRGPFGSRVVGRTQMRGKRWNVKTNPLLGRVEDVPISEIDGKKRPRVSQVETDNTRLGENKQKYRFTSHQSRSALAKGRLTKRNENLQLECSRVGEPPGM
ncbi:hypothetical protein Goklo_024660 [Gossypium klotzschianum]|uniref:Uncharacterized protein n=1 Tax=Gossypium klotzschianum TaxID=34286 RepID=A0A7J8W8Y5_9ROSI|nr:hypothetical protein [Gossypium klotzschianum]